jgi:hypothetical protein
VYRPLAQGYCVAFNSITRLSNVNEYKSVGDAAAAAQQLQQRCRYLTDDFLRLKVAYSSVVVLCETQLQDERIILNNSIQL